MRDDISRKWRTLMRIGLQFGYGYDTVDGYWFGAWRWGNDKGPRRADLLSILFDDRRDLLDSFIEFMWILSSKPHLLDTFIEYQQILSSKPQLLDTFTEFPRFLSSKTLLLETLVDFHQILSSKRVHLINRDLIPASAPRYKSHTSHARMLNHLEYTQ